MLKSLIAKTTALFPKALSEQWLMEKYTQIFSVGQSAVARQRPSKSSLLPKSFTGPLKHPHRHPRQAFSRNQANLQRSRALSKGSQLSGTPHLAQRRPVEVLVHREDILSEDSETDNEATEPTEQGNGKIKKKPRGRRKKATAEQSSASEVEGPPVLPVVVEDSVVQYRSRLLGRLRRKSKRAFRELQHANINLDFAELEKTIGHKFKEPKLLTLVLMHIGSLKREPGSEAVEEERGSQLALMWIGDAILQFLITEQLIARYNTDSNYQLHEARILLANRRFCAEQARRVGLEEHCVHGSHLKSVTENILGEMFEALIGVIYMDGGMEAASLFFSRQIEFPKKLTGLLRQS